jgi:nucleotide-binding universal stress UspA family protein
MTTRRRPRHLRVLLATDGSADARAAAECLARFPLPPSSVPLVLSVVTIPPSPISFPGLEDLKQSLLADGRRACEEAADVLRPRWPAVEVRVAEGEPREQILKTAKTWRPHLAVLGRRGLGGFERMLLGSVSLTAARHLACPVLVVQGPARPIQRIVVGVDGSEESLRAVNFVESLPLGPDVEVHLVAVAELLVPASLSFAAREALRPDLAEEYGRRQASPRDVLIRAANRWRGRPGVHTHTPVGDPAGQLLEMAATADLVVVGSRGLGAVRRLLLGTVSEKVLQHAPCSVLIVKDRGGPAA